MVAAVDEIAEDASAEVIAERKGMFGVRGTGDTSGYGGLRRTVALPGASTPPYGGWMDDVANALTEAATAGGLQSAYEKVVVHRGEITFFIRREDLLAVVWALRDDPRLRFELCSGVSGVNYPEDTGRVPTWTPPSPAACALRSRTRARSASAGRASSSSAPPTRISSTASSKKRRS